MQLLQTLANYMLLESLLPTVTAELPNVMLSTARDLLLRSARKLCSEGNAWVVVDNLYIGSKIIQYDLIPPGKAELVRVLRFEGMEGGRDFVQRNNTITLTAPLYQNSIHKLELACKPKDFDCEMEIEGHDETIIEGALYFGKKMTSVLWSDPTGAVAHYRLFEAGISESRAQFNYGNELGSHRVRHRNFI